MGWIGGALLVWFAVSLVAAPLIGLALRRVGELGSSTSAVDAPTIDLRRADGIRPTVLIVDTQPIRRLKMASTLLDAGFDVVEAGRPHLALTTDVVDVVIVDDACRMSADVLRRVRGRQPNVAPPVLMTQEPDEPAAWSRAGANDYLTKPFTSDELIAKVNDQLTRSDAWRVLLDAHAEQHAAVDRIMESTAGAPESASTAGAVCDVLADCPAVSGTALVSFAAHGATVLATAGTPPWDLTTGPVATALGESLERLASTGPRLDLRATGRRAIDGVDMVAATAPLGSRHRPLGLIAARLAPMHAKDAAHTGLDARGLATTIHLADVATTLLRTALEHDSGETSERIDLERIIGEHSFTPHFQPIVDLIDGSTVGYEALTRFDDGADPATRFHGAAALGVGDDLELVTLRAALEHASSIGPDQFIAINVSASFLTDNEGVSELISDIPRTVVIELSEHEAIADYDAVLRVLRGLDRDVRVSVDDAGAGFASLRHILLLQPDHVKLDRSWVHGVHDDPAKRAMITGIAHFARAIGAEVVAEGVEQREECETLIGLGVQLGQGWLFGRPEPIGIARGQEAAR